MIDEQRNQNQITVTTVVNPMISASYSSLRIRIRITFTTFTAITVPLAGGGRADENACVFWINDSVRRLHDPPPWLNHSQVCIVRPHWTVPSAAEWRGDPAGILFN